MREKVIIGVVTAVLTAAVFWLITKLVLLPSYVTVPDNAVIAFDSETCPTVGWEEYRPAYGRFIRGIDRSGTGIDPDQSRRVGSPQEDSFRSHSHNVVGIQGTHRNGDDQSNEQVPSAASIATSAVGGDETRPKNVALLYCRKR